MYSVEASICTIVLGQMWRGATNTYLEGDRTYCFTPLISAGGLEWVASRCTNLVCRLFRAENSQSPKIHKEIFTFPLDCLKEFGQRTCSRKGALSIDNYGIIWTRGGRGGGNQPSLLWEFLCVPLLLSGSADVCLPNIYFSVFLCIVFLPSKS